MVTLYLELRQEELMRLQREKFSEVMDTAKRRMHEVVRRSEDEIAKGESQAAGMTTVT